MPDSYMSFPDWILDSYAELIHRVNVMTNNGGPAFPPQRYTDEVGMSLRDYFAAQLLPTLVTPTAEDRSPEAIAAYAYLMADAMLKERAK